MKNNSWSSELGIHLSEGMRAMLLREVNHDTSPSLSPEEVLSSQGYDLGTPTRCVPLFVDDDTAFVGLYERDDDARQFIVNFDPETRVLWGVTSDISGFEVNPRRWVGAGHPNWIDRTAEALFIDLVPGRVRTSTPNMLRVMWYGMEDLHQNPNRFVRSLLDTEGSSPDLGELVQRAFPQIESVSQPNSWMMLVDALLDAGMTRMALRGLENLRAIALGWYDGDWKIVPARQLNALCRSLSQRQLEIARTAGLKFDERVLEAMLGD